MGELIRLGESDEELLNSLSGLCGTLAEQGVPIEMGGLGQQISDTTTMFINCRWYMVSNLRQLLSQVYIEHGVVQTLVDQPVDDAHRAGYELKSGMLDADDIEALKIFDEKNGITKAFKQAKKWARLYGGGAVMIITDQDPTTPLNMKAIGPNTPLSFRSMDMWELYFAEQNVTATPTINGGLGEYKGDFYDYYGYPVHKTRVLRIIGKECPSFLRPRLRGWGMSELERLVRSLNQYLKNQDVIFALLDEAKVDVYRINGFNTALLEPGGTQKTAQRIQMANQMKNFQSAIVMDAKDEYDQKQMTFAGLAEVLLQIRQGLAADLKMPMTKLFGVSAAGFSSGEDDIENYNSMLESEIRQPGKFQHIELLQIGCQKLFGTGVDDLMLDYNPLRILNAKEEEEVKDSQFTRVVGAYNAGLATGQEAKEAMNKDSLIGVEVDETTDALPPVGGDTGEDVKPAKGGAGKKAPTEA